MGLKLADQVQKAGKPTFSALFGSQEVKKEKRPG
jgi:hypothetical protein